MGASLIRKLSSGPVGEVSPAENITQKQAELVVVFWLRKGYGRRVVLSVPTELIQLIQQFTAALIDSCILNVEEETDLCARAYDNYGLDLGACTTLFRASEHGFGAETFHALCDRKGATLTVALTEFGHVIGGFTAVPWTSPPKPVYLQDTSAWLFVARVSDLKKGAFSGVRLPAILKADANSGRQIAHVSKIADKWANGPTFGGDLFIANDCDVNSKSLCFCTGDAAYSNECDGVKISTLAITGGNSMDLIGQSLFRVVNYEVFLVN